MSFSIQKLREDFKDHLKEWSKLNDSHVSHNLIKEIHKWGRFTEDCIQDKIKLLEKDFSNYSLKGEYFRSVTESFDDLERIMRTHKTLEDITEVNQIHQIITRVRIYYTNYLIPLLNILSKLESEYVAVTTKIILEKGKLINGLEKSLNHLYTEKSKLDNKFFDFHKNKKMAELSKRIQYLELRKKITTMTQNHDKMNLYYFTHDRPKELTQIKLKADKLREALTKLEEAQ